MKRIFLTVLDSFGIGEAPDAALFGDAGADTLRSVARSGELVIPNLISLGLGNIDGVSAIDRTENAIGSYARLTEKSRGKDTTTGHWELMGIVSENPMPTYPNGFPAELLDAFTKATGRGVLCNLPYSGTDVIRDFGKEHLESGKLIVYTSADSVFQIAAHESILSDEELYDVCRKARAILTVKHAVGRVIARPFRTDENGNFVRTPNRRDFSVAPPRDTVLNELSRDGFDVIGVGKIGDIFAMSGITETYPTHSNREGMETAMRLTERDFSGLAFINLVDFDSAYGHRQDSAGYARALSEFDRFLGEFIPRLKDGDVLMITADHGCDPSDDSTDHTREYVPFLMYSKNGERRNLGTIDGFAFVGQTVKELLCGNN